MSTYFMFVHDPRDLNSEVDQHRLSVLKVETNSVAFRRWKSRHSDAADWQTYVHCPPPVTMQHQLFFVGYILRPALQ